MSILFAIYSRGQNKVNVHSTYNDRATVLAFSFCAHFSFVFKSFVSVHLSSVRFVSIYCPFSDRFHCVVLNAVVLFLKRFHCVVEKQCGAHQLRTSSSASYSMVRSAFVVVPSFVLSLPACTSTR